MERSTRQRNAIRRALEAAGRPLSPQEVLDDARRRVPALGMATVYRTLNGLKAEGVIAEVEIPGEPPRWETAGKPHHHHFQCRGCGRLFEAGLCRDEDDDHAHGAPLGFEVEGHSVLIYGRCDDCRSCSP